MRFFKICHTFCIKITGMLLLLNVMQSMKSGTKGIVSDKCDSDKCEKANIGKYDHAIQIHDYAKDGGEELFTTMHCVP